MSGVPVMREQWLSVAMSCSWYPLDVREQLADYLDTHNDPYLCGLADALRVVRPELTVRSPRGRAKA